MRFGCDRFRVCTFKLKLKFREWSSIGLLQFPHLRNSRIKVIYGILLGISIPCQSESILIGRHIGGKQPIRAYLNYYFFDYLIHFA